MIPITPVIPGEGTPFIIYANDQPEYIPLPAHRQADGTVTTRWKLSWKERFEVLMGGCMWLQVLTFNRPLQPVKLSTICPLWADTEDTNVA